MGRLINTDDLIGCAIIKPTTSEEFGHILACENKIVHDDIPTAYDVESIVKEIRNKQRDAMSVKANKDVNKDFYKGVEYGYEIAIEIVRNGGVK